MFTSTYTSNRPGTVPGNRHRKRRITVAVTLVTTVALAVAACGGNSSDDSSSSTAGTFGSASASPKGTQTASNGDVYDDADVQFATQMVPHHQQALLMAEMASGRHLDPEVQQLVENVKAAQAPEIKIMTGWLMAWGKGSPTAMPTAMPTTLPSNTTDGSIDGHGMGDDDSSDDGSSTGSMGSMGSMGSEMPGMMSDGEMNLLEGAPGTKFQGMWLQMMVTHHRGAIEMAQYEQKNGAFPDAVALAESIETSQQREVIQMEKLLG